MANTFKYANQAGVAPIEGERISTNSHYTGEFLGTVMQDATVDGMSHPHERELGIVRFGTVMQDAIEGSTPTVGVDVVYALTNCTAADRTKIAGIEEAYTTTIVADEGKTLPATVTVKNGDSTLTVTTDYTWDDDTGVLAILADKITDVVTITVAAT